MFILAAEEVATDLGNLAQLIQTFKDKAIDYAPNVAAALAILILGWLAAKVIRAIVRRILKRAGTEPTITGFVVNILYAMLLVFVVISALGQLGINTNSFVAILGAAGLAVGFALQGSLSNFAAGVMLVIFKPFRQGDHVIAGGVEGRVQEIQIFSTIINTLDNRRVIVPNSQITGAEITNFTGNDARRVDMTFGIGYEDDIDQAKKIMADIVAAHPKVLSSPAPDIAVSELADSSVNFVCRPWCKPTEYWNVYWDITESVKKAFDEAGISIPFPQQDVHMHGVAAAE